MQSGLTLVPQARSLAAHRIPFVEAPRKVWIGHVRPNSMTAGTAIVGLLRMPVLRLEETKSERPVAVVTIGGLVTSAVCTLRALPAFDALARQLIQERFATDFPPGAAFDRDTLLDWLGSSDGIVVPR